MRPANLFADLPRQLPAEQIDDLIRGHNWHLERIISTGQSTPAGQWYDQQVDEWVILLTGSAIIRFQSGDELMELQPGDYLHIPAGQRHRVDRTDPDRATVWLALHFSPALG